MSTSTSRRVLLRSLAAGGGTAGLAALAALTDACAPGAAPAPGPPPGSAQAGSRPDRTFKAAYLTLGWAGIEMIHRLGLLERRGWRVEWQAVDQISALANAFASGQVDLIDMATVIAAQMYEQGVKMAAFGVGVGALGAVLSGKDSPVRSLPDLRGRKVAGIPGGATSQEINAHIRKAHGFDLFTDTQFVQGTTPPDVANLLTKGEVEGAVIWEPTTTLLGRSGAGRVIATQQQLWEQTFGGGDTEVHVMYLAKPEVAQRYPALLQDVNAAQAEVAELWKRRDEQAVQAMTMVTRLPAEVVWEALGRTTPLSGLSDRSIEVILQQLRFNREHGTILQSDVWSRDPDAARRDMFLQTG